MPIVLQWLNVSFWLAEELSDAHWVNVNNDTKAEVSIGFANDKRSDNIAISLIGQLCV
jgi:hypothetical protein